MTYSDHVQPSLEQLLPIGTRLGAVHLGVTDLDRSLAFWNELLGLPIQNQDSKSATLGVSADQPMIILTADAQYQVLARKTGLYHVAIHFPTRLSFARAIGKLMLSGVPHSPTDHLISEATYLYDPDGHGVELTFETPARGEFIIQPNGMPAARRTDGRLQRVSEPLDISNVLDELTEEETFQEPHPEGTRIGHVHLQVSDLDQAHTFYRDVIGFRELLSNAAFGMTDLSIEPSTVPHNLALNSWATRGADAAATHFSGLRSFSLTVPTAQAIQDLISRLETSGTEFSHQPNGTLEIRDPSKNLLLVRGA